MADIGKLFRSPKGRQDARRAVETAREHVRIERTLLTAATEAVKRPLRRGADATKAVMEARRDILDDLVRASLAGAPELTGRARWQDVAARWQASKYRETKGVPAPSRRTVERAVTRVRASGASD